MTLGQFGQSAGQWFPRYGPTFKIAIFGRDTWPLPKVPEVAHLLSFYPSGSKLSLFYLYWQRFLRDGPIFKLAIFGHETWPLPIVPDVAHIPSFYPRGSKLSLFLLYGEWLSRYGLIFKIAMFGHVTWPLVKVPEIVYIVPKLPPSPKFHSVLLYGWPFSRYWQFCIFPLAQMLNFNLFSKSLNFKFKNFKTQFLCGLLPGNIQKKFRLKRIKTVEE